MNYIDAFVLAVPNSNRNEYTEFASDFNPLFKQLGADRVVECWADDVPDGKQTDFRKAVQASSDESVVFAWVEWPDKTVRDAAMVKMQTMMETDDRFDAEKNPPPFDGQRMIIGGFQKIFEL